MAASTTTAPITNTMITPSESERVAPARKLLASALPAMFANIGQSGDDMDAHLRKGLKPKGCATYGEGELLPLTRPTACSATGR